MQGTEGTVGGKDDPGRLVRSVYTMASVLLNDETIDAVLQLLVTLAQSTMDCVDGASVSLLRSRQFGTQSATTEDVREADRVQYVSGHGPCLSAANDGGRVNIAVDLGDVRWPDFARMTADAGFVGVLSTPLAVKERLVGALNLYSRTTGPFVEPDTTMAQVFADQAAVVLANAEAFATIESLNLNLTAALINRDVIGMAKGVIIADQGCTADEAFDILRRASQRSNRKLHEVALGVVNARETHN